VVDEYFHAGIGATNNTNHSSRDESNTHVQTSAIHPPVNQHRCGKPTVCRSFCPGNHGLSPIFLYGFPRAIGGFEGILELKTPRVLPSTAGDECPSVQCHGAMGKKNMTN